jgi:hypothetical protein
MDTDRNRQGQQDRSDNSDDEAVVVDYITVTYDVSPTEAREIIRVCGCSDRSKIDNYMSDQGRSRRDNSSNTNQRSGR